jgi:hypothetical protein
MSDGRILEKVPRLSRRARYSGGARSDQEDLGKELDITDRSTPFCEFLQFSKKLNDVLVSCPCTKRQVTERRARGNLLALWAALRKLEIVGIAGSDPSFSQLRVLAPKP